MRSGSLFSAAEAAAAVVASSAASRKFRRPDISGSRAFIEITSVAARLLRLLRQTDWRGIPSQYDRSSAGGSPSSALRASMSVEAGVPCLMNQSVQWVPATVLAGSSGGAEKDPSYLIRVMPA
jgi:hypothetical protein